MNIIIIEDEVEAALDLKSTIELVRPAYLVQAVFDSVESSINGLADGGLNPNLIFSDIQLGDGLAFDIFDKIPIICPVVFCTAYDEYMLLAFKNNGVDYLLKPLNEKEVEKSLQKIEAFHQSFQEAIDPMLFYKALQEVRGQKNPYKTTFLVSYREKLLPLTTEQISYFVVSMGSTEVFVNDGKSYSISYTLDQLESLLNPLFFYRANRQTIIAYAAIKDLEHYIDRKIFVHLKVRSKEPIIISKVKAANFLRWLESH